MLLRWNEKSIKHCTLRPNAEKKIAPDSANAVLLPGINELSENDAECLLQDVQDEIMAGRLTVLKIKTKSAPGRPVRWATSIRDLIPGDAAKLIGDTYDPATLNRWLSSETRPDIRLLIEERLRELKLERAPKQDKGARKNKTRSLPDMPELDANGEEDGAGDGDGAGTEE